MTISTDAPPQSIGERYLHASASSDLGVRGGRCDADVLLAAGFAAAGNVHGALALTLYRMRETRDLSGFAGLVDTSANWIMGRSLRPGRNRLPRIARVEARDVATAVLRWWLDQTCQACSGRMHPFITGTNRLDHSRDCGACHGTGKSLVDHVATQHARPHARWLAGEFDSMAGAIFGAMARLLAPRLDL